MVVTQRMWDTLCTTIDMPELASDPKFETGLARLEHAEELYAIIAGWTMQHSKHEAMRILGEAGVPCSAVMDTLDLFTDPHLTERGLIHTVEHETDGPRTVMGSPLRMSDSEVKVKAAPLLGKHTDEVLAADLGMNASQLSALREKGAIL